MPPKPGRRYFWRQPEAWRVLVRIPCLVIIEVHIDCLQLRAPAVDAFGPCAQLRVGVAALIFRAGPMQPDVSPIRGDIECGVEAADLVNTECRVIAAQD